MMTLREFIEKVNFREHFRVYQPNIDCLIYESYFTVHSSYTLDSDKIRTNDKYYTNNSFCDDIRTKPSGYIDNETKIFLERFGDYKVIGLECSRFKPCDMYTVDGDIKMKYYDDDPLRPGFGDYINCFNVYII